jgi:mRNA interferase MazF
MIKYELGDILLIQFPFTDPSKVSKRPAVVLYDNGDMDVLLCRVTTRPCFSSTDFKVADWRKIGLLRESYIRVGKMATLEKDIVDRKLGSLKDDDIVRIRQILKQMFSL